MSPVLNKQETVFRPAALGEPIVPSVAAGSSRWPAVNKSRQRILYVDDEPLLRSLGQQILIRCGYEVKTADDGAEAWDALNDQKYHLLITDNQMPRLTGLELIRKMRRADVTVPVILASGTVGSLPAEDLLWLESSTMLAKPFTCEQLISVVREVLRPARTAQSALSVSLPWMDAFDIQPHQHWGINE